MAQHKSAQKRIRRTARRTDINRARLSRCRSSIKKVESALEGDNKAAAVAALKQMEPDLMRGVQKGVLKRNTASRKISRLSARIKALSS
jgi:small subunit ribosomal protein S20